MASTDRLDDMPSPKVKPIDCDFCPFDAVCEGPCIRGDRGPDDGGVGRFAVVGS